LSIVRVLLDAEADVHSLTTEGASVLHYLVRVQCDDGQQPLLQSLLERVTLGSRQEPDRMLLNSQNCHGETALHQAAVRGRETAVRVLLARGADPQLQSRFGETPLHVAARSGHAGVCRLLLA
jgi:ankyrin repeat protein